MSSFKVPLTKVLEVKPHPNADRLDIIKIYDWQVVTGKGNFSVGDNVIYVPVESILPQDLEERIFKDSKIKLNKHRVRSIKLRGQISQGLAVHTKDVFFNFNSMDDYMGFTDECDLAVLLGITKYTPPVVEMPKHMQVKKKKKGNPNFKKYHDIENFKYYDRSLQPDMDVYISEKLHGTSFRCGWFKTEANTWYKKLKKLLGLLPAWEFCYGSRMVEISSKLYYSGYYGEDIYGKIAHKYNLRQVIPEGFAIYGEIVGPSIQKGYTYGLKEHKLFVYDIMDTNENRYLDYPQFKRSVSNLGLNRVPELYVGPWNKEKADELRKGLSTLTDEHIREGIVIRTLLEQKTGSLSRLILKYINDDYYVKQTEIEGTEYQ